MTIRIVQLGTARAKDEGTRIGTVRRPPRGVPKDKFASQNWYDVWYPNLAPSVETMKQAGMRLREYRIDPGGRVNCTIRADEDAVVSRIRAPLAGVRRLDALQRVEVGGVEEPEVRLEDVPFDPRSGEFIFIPHPAALKKMPAHRFRVRLVSVGEAGEVPVGEYTFEHSPS